MTHNILQSATASPTQSTGTQLANKPQNELARTAEQAETATKQEQEQEQELYTWRKKALKPREE